MNVMVANNLQTDLDITNGAQGVITDIILNQDEPLLKLLSLEALSWVS